MTTIGVLDVGIGNSLSIVGSLSRLGCLYKRVTSPEDLQTVTHLIIPGVGHMSSLMSTLQFTGLDTEIRKFAQHHYLLGICLGFQLLFDFSEEGSVPCLGLLPGRVLSLATHAQFSTNVGYRTIFPNGPASPSTPLAPFYFTHSFFVPPTLETTHISLISHSFPIAASVTNGSNIFGYQFHPELSHSHGRILISNFINLK